MAELRLTKLDDELMAELKSKAALSRNTLKDFIVILLKQALKGRAGRQRP